MFYIRELIIIFSFNVGILFKGIFTWRITTDIYVNDEICIIFNQNNYQCNFVWKLQELKIKRTSRHLKEDVEDSSRISF